MTHQRLSPRNSGSITSLGQDPQRRHSSYGVPVTNAIIEDMNSSEDDVENNEEVKVGTLEENKEA